MNPVKRVQSQNDHESKAWLLLLHIEVLKKSLFCRNFFTIDFVPKTLREHWMVLHTYTYEWDDT